MLNLAEKSDLEELESRLNLAQMRKIEALNTLIRSLEERISKLENVSTVYSRPSITWPQGLPTPKYEITYDAKK